MSKPNFIVQTNGASYYTLVPRPISYEASIRRAVSIMREPDRSTLLLASLPEGKTIDDVTATTMPPFFLQAAGTSEAMTIEWGREEADGASRLYTVGRAGASGGSPDVRIEFFGGTESTNVYPNEVFDADEAGDIFLHYFHTLTVPESYVLREFDLSRYQS